MSTKFYFHLLIDATNTFDQARFFQEHAEQVFQVVYETCMHQIEKIKRKSCREVLALLSLLTQAIYLQIGLNDLSLGIQKS